MLASAHCFLAVLALIFAVVSIAFSERVPLGVSVLLLAVAVLLGCAFH